MVLAITLPSCGSVVHFLFAAWKWFGDDWWGLLDALLRLDLSELLICTGCRARGKHVRDCLNHTSYKQEL